MKKYKRVIGIDPDKRKSGFCLIEDNKVIELSSFLLCELFERLDKELGLDTLVCVEISDHSEGIFHFKHTNYSKNFYASLGYDVGVNHQTGRAIVEFLKYKKLDYLEQKALRKMWRGNNAKITHNELIKIIELPKKRSNQEERDAALIAYVNVNQVKLWK